MLTLKVRRFWQSRQQVVVGLLLCFCVLGLVPAGYGQADYVNQLINQLNAQD